MLRPFPRLKQATLKLPPSADFPLLQFPLLTARSAAATSCAASAFAGASGTGSGGGATGAAATGAAATGGTYGTPALARLNGPLITPSACRAGDHRY